jgi:curved DNA-binding protein CbpA
LFSLLPRTSTVQILLDFYRILGVPHRATLEQLQQAFDDRLQQLPRQEYSSTAIAARKQILEEAFVMLADPQKRQAYDEKIGAQDKPLMEGAEGTGLELDTPDKRLAGVLLVLQEIGAYPQILEIGTAYLERPIDLAKLPQSASALEDDVLLAMALANLELGREQWQQSQFEVAGASLQTGLDLLEREQRFLSVQAEIRGDLFKLRPYRILEALDDEEPEQRQKGLVLLQAMLDDRDGIDGNQDDQSGLSVNDFLRFVQQLREYLTVEEQQTLFEREAARPSAVASYLAVYSLIARGVSEGTPILVQRAKSLLTQLGDRQDVAIEVGMCWLLLGQPFAAHQSIQLSQDQDSLAFMRQYSEGAPDLIPGLYLYTENWLQQEVYPYFRDLLNSKVSLQSYFDNPKIQQVLGEIEPDPLSDEKALSGRKKVPANEASKPSKTSVSPEPMPIASAPKDFSESAVKESDLRPTDSISDLLGLDSPDWSPKVSGTNRSHTPPAQASPGAQRRSASPSPPSFAQPDRAQEGQRRGQSGQSSKVVSPARSQKRRLPRWAPWAIAVLLGTGVVAGALALGKLFAPNPTEIIAQPEPSLSSSPSVSATANSQPSPGQSAAVNPSPQVSGSATAGSPTPNSTASVGPVAAGSASLATVAATGPLSQADATQLIQSWQSAKAAAMSETHNTEGLKQVLAEPILTQWQSSVDQVQQNKGHWKYTLDQLEITAVEPQGKDRSLVKAHVKETRQYYEQGKLVNAQSYADSYRVQYSAIRKDQQWLIKDMQVLK